MKISRKHVFVTSVCLVGIPLLIVGGLAVWFRDRLTVMLVNREIEGTVAVVSAALAKDVPPLTTGDADWVCWRGLNGDGRSQTKGIPKGWSDGLPELWNVNYLCQNASSATWSAPVVQGNRLIVVGRDTGNDLVFCLDPEKGSLIWKASFPAEAKASYGTGARATPRIDGDRVYTFGRSGDLVCWGLEKGDRLWHRAVADEGGVESQWGHASSPLVTDSLVVVAGGGGARTIAYDKLTGELEWKSGNGKAGYAAIMEIALGDRKAALNFHGKGLCAVDLVDGREIWDTPWETSYDVNATTPVIAGDKVFLTSGYGTGCGLLQVSSSSAEMLWRSDAIAAQHSDPFIIDGYIYGYSGDSSQNRGTFMCVALETGEEVWSTNEMGWGTCAHVDDHLLCLDIKGNLYLMRPDPERFVKVAEMRKVFGKLRGAVWTVPVLANGRLYLRSGQRLICFAVRESQD
ncbi:MAG: PQQ-like beta-propeller repeat protein [Lentisphaerae bacterium]|jgi:outer membrane protein assembly factor BamB|nr:PQQ-like beta-propeller repeat protein [Lentisphaerota bacterium]MBT4817418.1 PQQ-like beta-propeller repeat protein [Lentisphaerota bacterium]MBT5607184.1 PQQ-like beta-propeller repeat protein [Lentisphaerota bacterium]MBT7060017.1 PQQ-like beta-propeller repeat protein [Lentisphaerota bacterium]